MVHCKNYVCMLVATAVLHWILELWLLAWPSSSVVMLIVLACTCLCVCVCAWLVVLSCAHLCLVVMLSHRASWSSSIIVLVCAGWCAWLCSPAICLLRSSALLESFPSLQSSYSKSSIRLPKTVVNQMLSCCFLAPLCPQEPPPDPHTGHPQTLGDLCTCVHK